MTAGPRRRTATLALGAALAALLTPLAPSSPAHADSFTFTSTDSFVIDDETTPWPSSLYVSGLPIDGVYDVDVQLTGLSHTWPEDLDVVLIAPDGTAGIVMSDQGGSTAVDGVDLVIDDSAATAPGVPLTSGTYRPADDDTDPTDADLDDEATTSLRDLALRTPANGYWDLYVWDDTLDEYGTLDGWSLTFRTATAPTITGPVPGTPVGSHDVEVRGAGTAGSRIFVQADEAAPVAVDVTAAGTWSRTFSGLGDGVHRFRASLSPLVGSSTTAWTNAVVDTVAPTGSLVMQTVVGSAGITSRQRVYLKVTPSEPLAGIRVSNDGEPLGVLIPDNGAPAPWLLADRDGARRIFVQLVDKAGNTSTALLTDSVTLERVAPRVNRTWPPSGATGVSRAKVVRARFDDFVHPNPGAGLSYLAQVYRVGSTRPLPAVVRYDRDSATVKVLPQKLLRADTRYKVVVGGFLDDAGNFLDQDPSRSGTQHKVWRFRTR
jgi:subtilisin-like proprotein convertase family protein